MKVFLYGLGTIGSNLLVQLSKRFPDFEYVGIDFDTVEERNIRTQAYFLEHVGMKKVQAMRVLLSRYNRKVKYTALDKKIEKRVLCIENVPEIHIDCFDNSASRKLFGFSHNILHIGFSPFYTAECIWNPDYSVPNDVDKTRADICSMDDAVGFIHFVVSLAALNISEFLTSGVKKNFLVTGKSHIKWL